MILGRHSGLLFAASATGAALALWGIALASIGHPDTTALADDRAGALALTVISAALWGFGWLRGRAIAYMLDMMLNQRAATRRAAPTVPLPKAVP